MNASTRGEVRVLVREESRIRETQKQRDQRTILSSRVEDRTVELFDLKNVSIETTRRDIGEKMLRMTKRDERERSEEEARQKHEKLFESSFAPSLAPSNRYTFRISQVEESSTVLSFSRKVLTLFLFTSKYRRRLPPPLHHHLE